ncbi:hypothetical protein [Bacillus sp. es.036]|uniref:hypothetical protein n=1 Tax=Bacillus sp. es.036 TaxID=1761764 RepID=UPI000BFA6AB8|nr:hypothetical protein [Bacillus sp. es.036]
MLQAMLDKKIPILQNAENKDKDFGSGYTIDSCTAVVLMTRSSVIKIEKGCSSHVRRLGLNLPLLLNNNMKKDERYGGFVT